MSRSGIVNVRMVITEEKILSNIEKVHKMINPKSKKQIIELDEDTYFKDLVEAIKTYLVEYPKKQNFPASVYNASFDLVEFATNQFEDNTKEIENLIRQREQNINLGNKLKDVLAKAQTKEKNWKESIKEVENDFDEDIINTLLIIGRSRSKETDRYKDAMKLINARISNLESNLHIEIDMERIEDRSKALSYIGIEIADALKDIPAPEVKEQVEEITSEPIMQEKPVKQKRGLFRRKEKAPKEEQAQMQNAKAMPQMVQNANATDVSFARAQNIANPNMVVNSQNLANNANMGQRMQNVANMNNVASNIDKQNMANINNAQGMNSRANVNAMQQNNMQRNAVNSQAPQGMLNQNVNTQNRVVNPMQNGFVQNSNVANVQRNNMNANLQQMSGNLVANGQYSNNPIGMMPNQTNMQNAQGYVPETFEAKPSLWQRFKNSKFVRTIKYIMSIKVVLEVPALPEGKSNN